MILLIYLLVHAAFFAFLFELKGQRLVGFQIKRVNFLK